MQTNNLPVLNIAICDDNAAFLPQAKAALEPCLIGISYTIECFTSAERLLQAAAYRPFDLALLDIQMPGLDGIRLADGILKYNPHCYIIFLTAYLAYAQDVYDVEHKAFIVKGELCQRLPVAIARFLAQYDTTRQQAVTVTENGRTHILAQKDIRYLEHQNRATLLYSVNRTIATNEKLENLLLQLEPRLFCQCHKSFAVNWKFVTDFDTQTIHIEGEKPIPVSRAYLKNAKQAFLQYMAAL